MAALVVRLGNPPLEGGWGLRDLAHMLGGHLQSYSRQSNTRLFELQPSALFHLVTFVTFKGVGLRLAGLAQGYVYLVGSKGSAL